MNTKNFIIGGIVGGVVFFLLGWLFYGNLLADFFAKNSGYGSEDMAEFKWWALILGNVFSGLLLAYVFLKSGVATVSAGAVTGAVIGFFMTGSIDLIMFGTTKMLNKSSLMTDIAVSTFMSAIAGAVIVLVINMLNKSTVSNTAV